MTASQERAAGRTALVTGAQGGIGTAIVERLLTDGWSVLAADLRLGDPACPSHDRRTDLELDVTSPASIAAAASWIATRGPLHALVNVAGLLQDVTPFLDLSDQQHDAVWDVNYFGTERCMRVFLPLIVAAGGGAVVNTTSVNEHRPLPLYAYAPGKAALGALTTLAAGEFAEHGVRVNAVAPGFTLTPTLRDKIAAGKRDASDITAHTAAGRLVDPAEVAAVVAFLLGEDASAVTGISVPVDAGWLATSHWMEFRTSISGGTS